VVISQIKAEQRVHEARAVQSRLGEAGGAWNRVKSTLAALAHEDLTDAITDDLNSLDALLGDARRDLGSFLKDYSDDVSRTSVVVTDLQEQGMRLRMLPANTIFQTFPRAVRDLAKQFNKDIELIVAAGPAATAAARAATSTMPIVGGTQPQGVKEPSGLALNGPQQAPPTATHDQHGSAVKFGSGGGAGVYGFGEGGALQTWRR